MSEKQTFEIEVPEGYQADGYREPKEGDLFLMDGHWLGGWRIGVKAPCAVPIAAEETPNELVRFRAWEIDGFSQNYIEAVDDIGGEWATHMQDDGEWWKNDVPCKRYKEIHPRLVIRRKDPDVEGKWVCEEIHREEGSDVYATNYPCDQNGNPLPAADTPDELVRFWQCLGGCVGAADDQGDVWFMDESDRELNPPDGVRISSMELRWTELHPHLVIRADGEGGWVAEEWERGSALVGIIGAYPCDQNGNPLEKDTTISNETGKPPVEGWIREDDYWLAPIEFTRAGTVISDYLGDDFVVLGECNAGLRCVGFLRLNEADPHSILRAAIEPYPCLLDWRATHAVMQAEGE